MADARTLPEAETTPEAPPSPTHATIRREDYRPPDWLVPQIELKFTLGIEKTRVQAKLTVERNPDGLEAGAPLLLNGDELKPLGVWIDGNPSDSWTMKGDDLLIPLAGDAHEVAIDTEINPFANSKLMGLYASNGMLCTQCEAEGFRRITFFPDRPDVLSRYKVRMEADEAQFPVLLTNGNPVETGKSEGSRHWAEWEDPFPKPCYLFALVAGDLKPNRDSFTTMSGRKVDLAIWVREADLPKTQHAMDSLKEAMAWDERVYGREYDLDLFNIVAVSDFNMGAMENKGLNIFNDKYVLADQETATDADFANIEAIIAHEYFHNWTGNRITCRDWFQLCLKEGLTVFRDHEFSADQRSRAVKRIAEVRTLRAHQFPEDQGPLAHPVRPRRYREINNFYTATVYEKGSEVVRMIRTILGADVFRAGMNLYFERHDGEAATIEDFIKVFEDASGRDLSQFALWYHQAGTPNLTVSSTHNQAAQEFTLEIEQSVPPTPSE
ncbi:MAG TPA: aminopeptidase N, partial [Anaerolineales bacterium]